MYMKELHLCTHKLQPTILMRPQNRGTGLEPMQVPDTEGLKTSQNVSLYRGRLRSKGGGLQSSKESSEVDDNCSVWV